ncbi:O-antigen ligase family protein [Candidatus Pacearchaeota archaeon]|nr:O-antigen ligase family protein [Candidatus Pacearchaeota archaeon]
MVTFYPEPIYHYLGKYSVEAISLTVQGNLLATLLPLVLIFSIPDKYLNTIIDLICIVGLISAIGTIVKSFIYPGIDYNWGIMTNTSIEGTFLAILAPIIFFKRDLFPQVWDKLIWVCRAIIVIAIFLTTSSIGIGGLIVGVISYYTLNKNWKLLFIPVILALVAYITNSHSLFYASGRYEIWSLQMSKWFEHVDIWTGTGFGTYAAFGPWLQKVYTDTNIIYPNLHSDVLQLMYEMGLYIFGLSTIIFLKICRKLLDDKNYWLLSSVMTYVAVSCINMPARYMPTLILGLILLRSCYVRMERSIPEDDERKYPVTR